MPSKRYHDYKNVLKIAPFNSAILERGDGNWVYDTDGNKYLDLNSGQFCLCFGHNDTDFRDLVYNQLGKIYHTNTSTLTEEVFDACADIASIMEGLTKTVFLSTGSEANECAYRYTRFASGKNGIIALNLGYHGLTLGSQQLTMGGQWARPNTNIYNYFITDLSGDNLESEFNAIISKSNGDIASVIVEPILGVGGIIVPSKKFFQKLRELCTRHNIYLIFDECQTGFGRTGKWFAYQHLDITPDVLVCAKSMGMGLAIASVSVTDSLAEKIENKYTHFSSHQNDPLSCKIVSYVINRIKKENYLEHNQQMGKYLNEKLTHLHNKYPHIISSPRGIGLMQGFDLQDDAFIKNPDLSNLFLDGLRKRGVLLQAIRRGKTIRMSPSYIITTSEIDFLIKAMNIVLDEINYNKL